MSSVIYVIFLVIGCALADLKLENDDSKFLSAITHTENLKQTSDAPFSQSPITIKSSPKVDNTDAVLNNGTDSTDIQLDSVPKELPADAFACSDSAACIKNLTDHKNGGDSHIDTEVSDLRNDTVLREEANIDSILNPPATQQIESSDINTETELIENGEDTEDKAKHVEEEQRPIIPEELSDTQKVNSSQNINTETKLIQNGEDTEDNKANLMALAEAEEGPGVPIIQGQLAAILAAVFVSVSIFAYVALLWYRRYLEHRYGSRTMLINEEEFDDVNINDLRHFSI